MNYTDLITALQIFEKYDPDGELTAFASGMGFIGMQDIPMLDEDRNVLLSLGWFLEDISPPWNRCHYMHLVWR